MSRDGGVPVLASTLRDRFARAQRRRAKARDQYREAESVGQLVLPFDAEAERRLDIDSLARMHSELVTGSVASRAGPGAKRTGAPDPLVRDDREAEAALDRALQRPLLEGAGKALSAALEAKQ